MKDSERDPQALPVERLRYHLLTPDGQGKEFKERCLNELLQRQRPREHNHNKNMLNLSDNFWNEIEATDFPVAVKDCLKGLISAHVNNTIPPQCTPAELDAMRRSGPTEVYLDRRSRGAEEFLIIMHYRPFDAQGRREFLYLSKGYPHGFNSPLSEE